MRIKSRSWEGVLKDVSAGNQLLNETRRCPLKLAGLWHQTWSEHRWCRMLWVRCEWSWEQLSKVGDLGLGKIFLLTLCHEQEEGRLPTSLIFQLCTSLLFQFLFFSLLLSHFLGSQPLLSPPSASILNPHLTRAPSLPPLPGSSSPLALPHPPSIAELLGKKTIRRLSSALS